MKKWILFIITITLSLVIFAGCGRFASDPGPAPSSNTDPSSGLQSFAAVRPDIKIDGAGPDFMESEDYSKWWEENLKNRRAAAEAALSLADFNQSTIRLFLSAKDENRVYSPLNLYAALSMLAETTGGRTREQILKLTGAADLDTLKARLQALWVANYQDNPFVQSLLANSIWLRNDFSYNGALLETLAKEYYADSFVGEMGSDSMNHALRTWTDENTGNLLSEYAEGMKTEPETVMRLVSAIYFQASWTDVFEESRTDRQIFHGKAGDEECDMMHGDGSGGYYWGDNFSAVARYLTESGKMYLILPDEGVGINEVLENEQLYQLIASDEMYESIHSSYPLIHLSLPKFNVHSKMDLTEPLKTLGMTDVFDAQKSDFTPLSDEEIFLSKADHAAMVKIDEEGVTGAAYTDLGIAGAGMPEGEIDFVLDRPFLFFITSADGSILFAGTVYDID